MPKNKLLHEGLYKETGHYVKAWAEGRGRNREIIVQVWLNGADPVGEPDGDWAMPGVLPTDAAIDQSILNTKP